MHCPACGTPLGDSQLRCSGCGYSFNEPLDPGADATPPGDRPHEVILATKLLALSLGLNLLIVTLVFVRYRVFHLMPNWALWITFGSIAAQGLFIALIWSGVRWARMLFLIVVGFRVALTIWGLMAAVAMNDVAGGVAGMYGGVSFDTAIAFYVAYLLLQPESRNWFYGRDVAV